MGKKTAIETRTMCSYVMSNLTLAWKAENLRFLEWIFYGVGTNLPSVLWYCWI